MTEPSITLTGDAAVALLEATKWLGRSYQPGDSLLNRIFAGVPEPEPVDPAVELYDKLTEGKVRTVNQNLAILRSALDKARAEGAASAVPLEVRAAMNRRQVTNDVLCLSVDDLAIIDAFINPPKGKL